MKERVSSVLGRRLRDFGRLDQPWPMICTFHSLCLRIFAITRRRSVAGELFDLRFGGSDRVVKDALKTLEMSSTNFSPARFTPPSARRKTS
jgi:superfamily I DNA/RNA helicase